MKCDREREQKNEKRAEKQSALPITFTVHVPPI